MKHPIRNTILSVAAALVVSTSLPTAAHFDDAEPLQSYRQSYFALLAMNFGPIAAMVKGEMPWDQAALQGYADDMAALGTLNLMRGFAPGSNQGTTRAKPEIWENTEDFKSKLDDLQSTIVAVQAAAQGGDKQEITKSVVNAGNACKACHDDYKAKNYLY